MGRRRPCVDDVIVSADVLVGRIWCQPLFALRRNFEDLILQPERTILPSVQLWPGGGYLADGTDKIKFKKI